MAISRRTTYHRLNYTANTTLTKNAKTKGQWIGFGGPQRCFTTSTPITVLFLAFSSEATDKPTKSGPTTVRMTCSLLDDEFLNNLAYQQTIPVALPTPKFNLGYEWTTDYIKKFSNHEDRELRIAFQLGGDISDQDNYVYQNLLNGSPTDSIINNDGSPLSYTYHGLHAPI